MYKCWGEGDVKLLPLYAENEGIIIRRGREDAETVLQEKKEEIEFLY